MAKFFISSEPTSTFSPVSYVRTPRNGTKMLQERFTVDTGKSFFAVSVIKHWHRLPGEVAGAHTCLCSRGVWIKPAIISLNFWLALKRLAVGVDDHCRSPPTELFYSTPLHSILPHSALLYIKQNADFSGLSHTKLLSRHSATLCKQSMQMPFTPLVWTGS